MSKFEEITEARTVLGLGETATLKEIKQAYREMASRHHPDKNQYETNDPPDEEMMKKLNLAYRLLMDYCNRCRCSFKEEDIDRAYPYDKHFKKFFQDGVQ